MSTSRDRLYVGLDLGQAKDFAALAVLSKPPLTISQLERDPKPPLSVVHLQRWPLGTKYPALVNSVVELLSRPQLAGAVLAVDATGPGRPVVDMLRDALSGKVSGQFIPVNITSGSAVTPGELGGANVPKKVLVETLQKLLRARRLRVAETLPEAQTLIRELGSFEMRISEAANENYGAAAGRHDDLLLALMLGAWTCEHRSMR